MKVRVSKECYLGDTLRNAGDEFEWFPAKSDSLPDYIEILDAGKNSTAQKTPLAKNGK